METKTTRKARLYFSGMRAAHPATGTQPANANGDQRGPGHGGHFHHCGSARHAKHTAVSVERRQRASHAHKALYDLIDALEQESTTRGREMAEELREVAVGVATLANP